MTVFVALLRAVNVGGTGLLRMHELVRMAAEAGFRNPRTLLASGNLILESGKAERAVKAALERALSAHMGRRTVVMVRTAAEVARVVADNPFRELPAQGTSVFFLDSAPPPGTLDEVVAPEGEQVRLGTREIYVFYPHGMGRSKLKLPAAREGTARGIATVARLAEAAAAGK